MSGQLLRSGHEYRLPHGELSDVWRCECGRRWVCTLDYTVSADGRAWKRRILPWPRVPRGGQARGGYRGSLDGRMMEPPPDTPSGAAPGAKPKDPPADRSWLKMESGTAGHHCPGCRCGE